MDCYDTSGCPGDCEECVVHEEQARIASLVERAERAEARARGLETVLRMAKNAMNYMGDALNEMDACEPCDVAATEGAFAAVRLALGEPMEGDNEIAAQCLDPALVAALGGKEPRHG